MDLCNDLDAVSDANAIKSGRLYCVQGENKQ